MAAPVRPDLADRLLDTLDDLVRRHRGLGHDAEHPELHAELIAAEVDHALALTRYALRRARR